MSSVSEILKGKELTAKFGGRIGTEMYQGKRGEKVVVKTFPEEERRSFHQSVFMEKCVIPRYGPILVDEEERRIVFPYLDYMLSEAPYSLRGRSVFVDYCLQFFDMYSRGYYHWDVRPENLMVSQEGKGVVIDLGVATVFSSPQQPWGSYWFYPPETIAKLEEEFTEEEVRTIDVFSLALSYVCSNTGRDAIWGSYERMRALERKGLERRKAVLQLYAPFLSGDKWAPAFQELVRKASRGNKGMEKLLFHMLSLHHQERPTWLEVLSELGISHSFNSLPFFRALPSLPEDPPEDLDLFLERALLSGAEMCVVVAALQMYWASGAPHSSCLAFSEDLNDTFVAHEKDDLTEEGVQFLLKYETCSALGIYHVLHLQILGHNPYLPQGTVMKWSEGNQTLADYWKDLSYLEAGDQTILFLQALFTLFALHIIPDAQGGERILEIIQGKGTEVVERKKWMENFPV